MEVGYLQERTATAELRSADSGPSAPERSNLGSYHFPCATAWFLC